ncbi:hypothetical protein HKX48_006214 [Thoreauomyces humboldtii]|nr:hypothetical protein HKX48_006214 [Thoreauomyces humboldtii]
MLVDRGQIKETEVRKLGELNAELFGHANTRQKIKHVAQLKEENVNLKTLNMALSRRVDDQKRKIMNLERDQEAHRGISAIHSHSTSLDHPNASFSSSSSATGPRKLSRVARSALSTTTASSMRQPLRDHHQTKSTVDDRGGNRDRDADKDGDGEEGKENVGVMEEVSFSEGGMSFVV